MGCRHSVSIKFSLIYILYIGVVYILYSWKRGVSKKMHPISLRFTLNWKRSLLTYSVAKMRSCVQSLYSEGKYFHLPGLGCVLLLAKVACDFKLSCQNSWGVHVFERLRDFLPTSFKNMHTSTESNFFSNFSIKWRGTSPEKPLLLPGQVDMEWSTKTKCYCWYMFNRKFSWSNCFFLNV